ncbi:hypothetical protein B0H14DRAFT_2625935 [Mycena olivaceomarginata]|nr:hypothetical protein B0H14DRAFT_2625935 [Mycena olivaceomarginata]
MDAAKSRRRPAGEDIAGTACGTKASGARSRRRRILTDLVPALHAPVPRSLPAQIHLATRRALHPRTRGTSTRSPPVAFAQKRRAYDGSRTAGSAGINSDLHMRRCAFHPCAFHPPAYTACTITHAAINISPPVPDVSPVCTLRPPRLNPSTSHPRRIYRLPIRHTCIPSMDALEVEYLHSESRWTRTARALSVSLLQYAWRRSVAPADERMRKCGVGLPTTPPHHPPPAPVKPCVPNPAARQGGVRFRPTSNNIKQRETEKEENLWGCSTKIEKSNEERGVVRQRERENGKTLRHILMPHRQSECRKVVHVMEVEVVGVLGVTRGSVLAEDQRTAQDFVRKSGMARGRRECWTEDEEHKDGERAMTKLRCRARLQRGIVYLQLTQSICMPGEYIVQANVLDFDGGRDPHDHPLKPVHFPRHTNVDETGIPAPSTVQAGYRYTILRKASERGNGEQIPGSGVWALLPRFDVLLTYHGSSTLKPALSDRRYSL